MNFPSKRAKVIAATKALDDSLAVLSPNSKVDALSVTCNSLPPESKETLSERVDSGKSLVDFTKSLSSKRDNASNCARHLAYRHLVQKSDGNHNRVRRMHRGLRFTSLKNASEKDIQGIIKGVGGG